MRRCVGQALRTAFLQSASRPGRSPCSISSSEAPPPVEMWSTSVGEAELRDGGRGVAAADDRERRGLGHRLGDRAGAGLEAWVLEHAHRTVPQDRAGVEDRRRRTPPRCPGRCRRPSSRRAGRAPNLRTSPPASGRRSCRPGRGRRCRSGRCRSVAGSSSNARSVSTWSSSHSELPIGWPWALRNVKHMPPPMRIESATCEQGVDHAELVGHLRAAGDGDERARADRSRSRAGPRPPWPAAGRRPTAGLRRADDRGVGPVRRAERVVDVERRGPRSADATKAGSLAVLARVEPQVLEQLDAGRELGEPGPHRLDGVLRVGRALGPAEVGARGDRARPGRPATRSWAARRGCGGRR